KCFSVECIPTPSSNSTSNSKFRMQPLVPFSPSQSLPTSPNRVPRNSGRKQGLASAPPSEEQTCTDIATKQRSQRRQRRQRRQRADCNNALPRRGESHALVDEQWPSTTRAR